MGNFVVYFSIWLCFCSLSVSLPYYVFGSVLFIITAEVSSGDDG
jgi:hypothetical protein